MVAGQLGNTFVLIGWGKPVFEFIKILNKKIQPSKIIILTHPKKYHTEDIRYFDNDKIFFNIFKLKEKNIEIIENKKITDTIFRKLKKYDINLMISVGSKFIFKKKFIKIFKGKLVNFHPSLLPEERGGANFSYRILEKKKFSAASAHFVDEKIDSGDIIFQIKKFNIKKYDLYEYFFKTYENYNGLFKKILNSMKKKKKLNRTAQLNINATYFKKLKSDIHGKINFNWDIKDIDLFIKAFGRPYKGSYCFHRDKKIYILSSRIYSKIKVHPFLFGKVKNINKDGSILVFCNNGILKVEDVSLNKNIIKADKIFKLSSWLK